MKILVLVNLVLLSAFVTLIPIGVFSASSPSCGIVQESGHIIGTYPSVVTDQASDSYGDVVIIQTCGFALDPLAAGNPPNNYYLMDIQVSASAATGRSVDTSGLGDSNGPTLVVTSLLMCSGCTVNATRIWPRGTLNSPGGVPVTATVGASYGGVSAGVNWTWTPPSSQSNLVNETQTEVQWAAGDNEGGATSTFTWTFQEVAEAPNTEASQFYMVAKGNFYGVGNCGFAACSTAHPFVTSQHSFSTTPTTSTSTTVTNPTSAINTLSTTTQTVTSLVTSTSTATSAATVTSLVTSTYTVTRSTRVGGPGLLDETSALLVASAMIIASTIIALLVRRGSGRVYH